jgi:hypothetical protein
MQVGWDGSVWAPPPGPFRGLRLLPHCWQFLSSHKSFLSLECNYILLAHINENIDESLDRQQTVQLRRCFVLPLSIPSLNRSLGLETISC